MGAFLSCNSGTSEDKYLAENPPVKPQKKSWETRRETLDPKDFIFSMKHNETLIKQTGSIDGRAEMVIEDCVDCKIYIKDRTVQVTIDMCTNCVIFIGPCEGSVFIRNSKNCVITGICQQFRSRDCSQCKFMLHSSTQPSIEQSTSIKFACLQVSYAGLERQFQDSKLSVWNNEWWKIHDFTRTPGCSNYSLDGSSDMATFAAGAPEINFDTGSSMIPYTYGKLTSEETRCMLVSNCPDATLLNAVRVMTNNRLLQTKMLSTTAVQSLNLSDAAIMKQLKFSKPSAIALEFSATNGFDMNSVKEQFAPGTAVVYISVNSATAEKDSSQLFKTDDFK